MNSSGGMFSLLRDDYYRKWSQPPSWWNLMVLWPIPFVLMFCVYTLQADFEIAKRQRTTVATINLHDPPNHDRYGYVFSIAGHNFTGWAYPNDKRGFTVGERIVVYYDPTNPEKKSTSDFHSVGLGVVLWIGFCLLALVAVPLSIYFQRRAKRRDAEARAP